MAGAGYPCHLHAEQDGKAICSPYLHRPGRNLKSSHISVAKRKPWGYNGNKNEERLVNIMGGAVIETESEKLIRRGRQQGVQNMEIIGNKFNLEDLYIGMEIQDKDQLSDIYDTWIILVKSNGSDVYTIRFIGKETNTESDKLFTQGNVVCPVYNDRMELEGDIYYEE